MSTEIIDLVNPTKLNKKKIELLYCLQARANNDDEPHFYKSNYDNESNTKLIRIGVLDKDYRLGCFDLIMNEKGNLFLGNWNDGVV